MAGARIIGMPQAMDAQGEGPLALIAGGGSIPLAVADALKGALDVI